jgi:DNA-binding cell septation regulator SpoVG
VKITIEHIGKKYSEFTVHLASKEGADPFLSIRGVRIVKGSKGDFLSWPARKLESGKYWNHCWASEKFAAAVMEEARATMPEQEEKKAPVDDDLPF